MFWQRWLKKKAFKEIEGDLFQYMVNKQHVPLDVLRNLRVIESSVTVGSEPVGITTFRVINPATIREKGITVDNYEGLDDYPELVLYEGYYQVDDGDVNDIYIEKQLEK